MTGMEAKSVGWIITGVGVIACMGVIIQKTFHDGGISVWISIAIHFTLVTLALLIAYLTGKYS